MADLKVVPLFENRSPKIGSLHDRIVDVLHEYAGNLYETENRYPTKSEIIGTLEFVKAEIMGVEFEE